MVNDIVANETKEQVMGNMLKKIKGDMTFFGITREELAKYVGIAKSTLSDILNGHIEISFNYLVKVIMKVYNNPSPELKNQMISDYLAYAKPENKREALEYAAFRREFDSLKKIIDEEIKSPTDINREWAEVYQVIYNHCRDKGKDEPQYSPYTFNDDLEKKKTEISSKEMKALVDILLCQTLYQMKEYKLLFNRIGRVEKRTQKIPNKFIRNCFLVRIKEGMSVTYLMQNEILNARQNCTELFKICDKNPNFSIQKANVFYNLGESYLFESYRKSKRFLECALSALDNEIFRNNEDIKRKRQKINSTLIFLKIHHFRDIHTLPDVLDKDDQAYLEFKRENYHDAVKILLEMEKENGSLNEFQTCYMGLAKNDKSLLEKSYSMFLKKKSLFYAKIPQIYLGYI
ncbi:AimR family lysis-lysogeny pheromone receptor [Bacillus sp. AFS075034]|uniref:AimR family lysis-lysogeny pheromone receptor n=1 Tax=Bacillus sp. AFS075034 TaxID=2034281 RepID=UPI00350E4D99